MYKGIQTGASIVKLSAANTLDCVITDFPFRYIFFSIFNYLEAAYNAAGFMNRFYVLVPPPPPDRFTRNYRFRAGVFGLSTPVAIWDISLLSFGAVSLYGFTPIQVNEEPGSKLRGMYPAFQSKTGIFRKSLFYPEWFSQGFSNPTLFG
jgi:hypothetical protein